MDTESIARTEPLDERFQLFKSRRYEMENLGTRSYIKYINDSKSTNVNTAWYALTSTPGPIIWIAGGTDIRNDYTPLFEQLHKVKAMVCIGIDNTKLHKEFGKKIDVMINLTDMFMILETAKALASYGDTILFSPGCASFDLYKDWEDRGRKFTNAFYQIA